MEKGGWASNSVAHIDNCILLITLHYEITPTKGKNSHDNLEGNGGGTAAGSSYCHFVLWWSLPCQRWPLTGSYLWRTQEGLERSADTGHKGVAFQPLCGDKDSAFWIHIYVTGYLGLGWVGERQTDRQTDRPTDQALASTQKTGVESGSAFKRKAWNLTVPFMGPQFLPHVYV